MDATLEPRLVIQGIDDTPHVHGAFHVPAYQRGYRWGRHEVRALLNDLLTHGEEARAQRRVPADYFLQPVVVLPRDDCSWELVDGQQRLTTLYLIARYLSRHAPQAQVAYTLTYATRDDLADFLDSLDRGDADLHKNIDYFHLAAAYDAIVGWFESGVGNPSALAHRILDALSSWVYVIWYEAPADTQPIDLFIRLNRDRIPLTESELVKALVLSSSGVERRDEVAAQWDRFEVELRDSQLWAFLTGSEKSRRTHIDFLLETMPRPAVNASTADAVVDESDQSRHWLFDRVRTRIASAGVEHFWSAVVAQHGLLVGWFKDPYLYHRVGYLVAIGDSISDLVQTSHQLTHSEFREGLVERTRQRLKINRDKVSLLRYGKDDAVCTRLLLLMNVETVRRSDDSTHRFNFHGYASAGWSLEHVHAQRAESPDHERGRRDWLAVHRDKIHGQAWPPEIADRTAELIVDLSAHLDRPDNQVDVRGFERLHDRVITLFDGPGAVAGDEDTHGLGNLALLQRDINSALNNAVFALKRDRILAEDRRGTYLLPCTRNVFLKTYTRDFRHVSLWGPADRDAYYEELMARIAPFLLDATEDERNLA